MQINVGHTTSDRCQPLRCVASKKDLFARMPMRRKANEQVTLHPVDEVIFQTVLLTPAQRRILRLALLSRQCRAGIVLDRIDLRQLFIRRTYAAPDAETIGQV